jgi:hypothetical protein
MVGDLPPKPDEGSTIQPPTSGEWLRTYPNQTTTGSRTWAAIALAAIAVVVAVAALILAITRPKVMGPSTTAPTYTAAETAAAQRQLCDTYKLVAQAVQVDTNANDRAIARITVTNGAAMLEIAAANPALDITHRDAARALANAYRTTIVVASGGTEAAWHASVEDGNAKDAAMKKVCVGG